MRTLDTRALRCRRCVVAAAAAADAGAARAARRVVWRGVAARRHSGHRIDQQTSVARAAHRRCWRRCRAAAAATLALGGFELATQLLLLLGGLAFGLALLLGEFALATLLGQLLL